MKPNQEELLYEFLSSLSLEDQDKILNEINDNESEIDELLNVKERLLNERIRDKYYWEIYYLIDKEDNLTTLGKFYAYIFTGHYIKALKLYLNFTESIRNKNKVLYKNEKANEYLKRFGNFISLNKEKVLIRS